MARRSKLGRDVSDDHPAITQAISTTPNAHVPQRTVSRSLRSTRAAAGSKPDGVTVVAAADTHSKDAEPIAPLSSRYAPGKRRLRTTTGCLRRSYPTAYRPARHHAPLPAGPTTVFAAAF